MIAFAFLAAAAAASAPDTGAARFADAAGCRLHLERLVAEARGSDHDAVEGPYEVAPGDVRAHMVEAEGAGHRIIEHRCAGAELSSRSWTRSMAGDEAEAFTIESAVRRAAWLKQGSGEQQ